jgi:hypothetical protein
MAGNVKVSGVWQNIQQPSVKIAGSWKQVTQAWVKVSGAWVSWFVSTISDAFGRADTVTGLGIADSGQAWVATRGNWFVNLFKAKSTDTPSNYPIAGVDAGSSNATITLDTDGNGAGAAFWITDTANWHGVVPFQGTTTSYSQNCTSFSQVNNGYTCGGSYSQTGPTYTCGGSYAQAGGGYYCGGSVTFGTGYTCSGSVVQTGPSYSCTGPLTYFTYEVCNGGYQTSQTGPFYSCVGPTFSSEICSVGYSRGYIGSGIFYQYCSVGTYTAYYCQGSIYGPYYGTAYACPGGFSTAGSTTCDYDTIGPTYGYSCQGTVSSYQTSSCNNPIQNSYYPQCTNTQGPTYGQTCSNPVGPNYSSTCSGGYYQGSSTSAGTQYLRLIKSVANTVTTVVDQAVTTAIASIKVILSGNSITASAYTSAGQTTQTGSNLVATSTAGGTTHGIILAPGGYTQSTTIDNVTVSIS